MALLGSIGVALLLGAFFANLVGWLEAQSRVYQGLNALGAAIAACASYGIGFVPFVVLEGTWCVVALASLLRPRGAVPSGTSVRNRG
jgi:hypothetical protein